MRSARVLLLIPAQTYRAADFMLAANRMKLDLLVASDGALPLGDRPVVHVDPDNLEQSVDRLVSRAGQLDAIVAADTAMTVLAATVASRMGLPHNSVAAVTAVMDKTEQRRLWATADIPQPAFRVVPEDSTEDELTRAAGDVGFPCVVKAVSLSGSQGVLRADDETRAAAAATKIRHVLAEAHRPAGEPLLIEEYVPGREVSVDGLLSDGSLTVTAIFDKPDAPEGPTFEETLLVTPSRLPETVLTDIVGTAERAARALGLRYGPIHAELRVDSRHSGQAPRMLELAARSIGGLCSRALRFLEDVSLEEMVLANALGAGVVRPHLARPSGVMMLHAETAGTLRAVLGVPEAAAMLGITGLSVTIPLGQRVRPLPDGDRYLGFIFAEGETPEDVAMRLRAARDRLHVVIQ